MSGAALSHLTVVDLTHYVAGPFCAKFLAGFGANVVKIERPRSGDPIRARGPFVKKKEDPENGIPFLWLNTGKKSVTINLKSGAGRDVFKDLVRRADVVIESFSPRVMPSLGLDYETLRAIRPDLVMTSVSSFGQTGPYRDYQAEEIVEYALSGLMYLTGDPDKAPLQSGPLMTQYTAGMLAYVATLMALYQRAATGRGQHVDVSIQECALDNIEIALMEFLRLGKVARRTGDEHALVPWQVYACKDGHAAIIGGPVRNWLRGAAMFEEPRLREKIYEHMGGRIQRREEVKALLQPWASAHGKKEIYHAGQARKLAFGYVATLPEVLESAQHRERGFFETIDHPVAGSHPYCAAPFRPSATPWRSARAPLLGEHNDAIYGGLLGYTGERIDALRQEGAI